MATSAYRILHREHNRLRNQTIPYKFKFRKSSAEHRKLSWELTLEQFSYLLSEGCFVTGCCDKVTGLDRLDNAIGYTFANVRPSCYLHNVMRGQLLDQEYIRKCKEVVAWSNLL